MWSDGQKSWPSLGSSTGQEWAFPLSAYGQFPMAANTSGLSAAPWTMGGMSPAGAIRSTTHDLSIWLKATADGTAPGAKAAAPRENFDESDRIGWAWLTTTDRSPNLTWHNGGTGGYGSYLGFDAKTRQGVIVLADSAIGVDDAADLISSDSPEAYRAQYPGARAGDGL